MGTSDIWSNIGWYVGLADIRCISEGYGIFVTFSLGIIISVIAFIVAARQRKIEYREQNSSKFIAGTNEEVNNSFIKLAPLIYNKITAEKFPKFLRDNYEDFFKVARHFETTSVYMAIGYASERIITKLEHNNIYRFFISISPYLSDERNKDSKSLIHLESYIIRTKIYRNGILAFVFNLFVRDAFLSSRLGFMLHYKLLKFFGRFSGHWFCNDITSLTREITAQRILGYIILLIIISWFLPRIW